MELPAAVDVVNVMKDVRKVIDEMTIVFLTLKKFNIIFI